MIIPRKWSLNEEGRIVVALEVGEMHAICQALNVTTSSMTDSQFHSRIGTHKNVAQNLLDELLAIVDTVDPPPPPE